MWCVAEMFCTYVNFLPKIHKGFDKKEDSNDSADTARQGFYHFAEVPKNLAQIFLTYSRWSIFFVIFFLKILSICKKFIQCLADL